MTRAWQVLVGLAALGAGAGTAGAVALGAADGTATITIVGQQIVQERQGTIPALTIYGRQGQVLTIAGRGDSATAGQDFRVKPQVITLSGQERGDALTINGAVADDEADEPAERFFVDACGPSATGEDEDCDGSTDEDRRTSHPVTIADDDGALDAAICGGLLRPVGVLLGQLRIAGLFAGCS